MKQTKINLLKIKERFKKVFPVIFVSLFLFFTLWHFFGIGNTILPPFLTLLFLFRYQEDFNIKKLLRMYGIIFVVALMAFLSRRNLILCASLNFLVPFMLVYLFTNKFNPKAYYIYGMEFIFLQFIPLPLEGFILQLGALLYGVSVITIVLYVHSKIIKRKRNYGTVRKGMKNLTCQIEKLIKNEDFSTEAEELMEMMVHLNQVIYSTRNYKYLATGYGKINYYFMVIFQRFHYFMKYLSEEKQELNAEDKEYLLHLSEIFTLVGENLNEKDNSFLKEKIEEFLNGYDLSLLKEREAITAILDVLKFILSEIEKTSKYKTEKKWQLPNPVHKPESIREILKLDLFQVRFAIRLSITLCIAFSFVQYTKLDHSYWYPMSVFFMLMPYSEESILKINNRILGTVIGLFIVFFMGVFFQGTVERAILIVLLTSLMYYSTPTSWIMTMYSTCFGMVLTTMILQVEQAVILRTIYVGMAVVTAFFMNYFVFPNTVKREFQHNLNQLFDIDTKIIKEITKTLKGNIDFNVVRDLIVHSNMVSKEIKTYVSENLSEGEKEFYLHLLSINHKLIMEMEQLNGYIYKNKSDMDLENNMIIQELFNNFEEAINEIQKNYEKNELSNFPKLDKELRFSKKLDDKLYFNFLAFNCLKTVGHLTEYTSKIHAGSH